MERGPTLNQDVSLKYLTLAQTSKLVFSFLSPTHPSLEAESIKPSRGLNRAWAWVEGRGGQQGGKKLAIISKMFPAAI